MAKAKKLQSGNWRCQYYVKVNGQNIRKSVTAKTKKEAEQLAAIASADAERIEEKRLFFREAVENYLSTLDVSPTTMRGYRIIQRNAFMQLDDCMVQNITDDTIRLWLSSNKKKYKEKTLKNQCALAGAVLKWAGSSVVIPKIERKTKTEIKVPTLAEFRQILSIIKDTDIECQILLAATCSLRQSEIGALTANHISGNVVTVDGALVLNENNKLVHKDNNKTLASKRQVVMPERLTMLMQQKCCERSTGLLFAYHPATVLRKFKRLLIENNMHPYSVHAMRHAFAAFMHHSGVPDQYIMRMGGWASNNVLKSVYQYAFDDETKKIKEDINSLFDKIAHENAHDIL